MNKTCVHCGGATRRGEVRSGLVSFGSFFLEYDGSARTLLGLPKLKPEVRRDNRVVSLACERCGLITSYLEKAVL